jgi:hypothetical protein
LASHFGWSFLSKEFVMQKFSKEDWYGLAGATKMTDESGPFIGEIKIAGKEYTLVVGGNWDSSSNVISVIGDQDADGFAEWNKDCGPYAAPTMEIANQFEKSDPSSFDVLAALGFTKVL